MADFLVKRSKTTKVTEMSQRHQATHNWKQLKKFTTYEKLILLYLSRPLFCNKEGVCHFSIEAANKDLELDPQIILEALNYLYEEGEILDYDGSIFRIKNFEEYCYGKKNV
jgi:hypothetical protein